MFQLSWDGFRIVDDNGNEIINGAAFFVIAGVVILLTIRFMLNRKRKQQGKPVSWIERRKDKNSILNRFFMMEDTLGMSSETSIEKDESNSDTSTESKIARLEKELAEAKAKQEKK